MESAFSSNDEMSLGHGVLRGYEQPYRAMHASSTTLARRTRP